MSWMNLFITHTIKFGWVKSVSWSQMLTAQCVWLPLPKPSVTYLVTLPDTHWCVCHERKHYHSHPWTYDDECDMEAIEDSIERLDNGSLLLYRKGSQQVINVNVHLGGVIQLTLVYVSWKHTKPVLNGWCLVWLLMLGFLIKRLVQCFSNSPNTISRRKPLPKSLIRVSVIFEPSHLCNGIIHGKRNIHISKEAVGYILCILIQ